MEFTGIFLIVLGFAALVFASISDIKTREVPDWLSFGLIVCGFIIRLIHSLVFQDIWYLINGLIGFIAMLAVGLTMYYTKQWGGGDAKLVMGLGIVFAAPGWSVQSFLLSFSVNVFIFGAIYGIFWSVYLAIRNWSCFSLKFHENFAKKRTLRMIAAAAGVIALFSVIFIDSYYLKFSLCSLALSFFGYSYIHVFVKSVEDSCMYKRVNVKELTEGDWVAEEVYVNKRLICGPKDLGLERPQINALLKSKVKDVLVKEGIPFVPSFFISALFTLVFGNLVLLI